MIQISVVLPPDEAEAFAQFLKRVGQSDYRRLARDDEEAYAMLAGGEKVREALVEAGVAPR